MRMHGGALPWVLLILTVLALLFMYVLVDAPEQSGSRDAAAHSSLFDEARSPNQA